MGGLGSNAHPTSSVSAPRLPSPLVSWIIDSSFAWIPGLATLVLCLWGLTSTPLWKDELATLDAIHQGPWTHSWEPMHIPYYLLMAAWSIPWTEVPDWWLRLPSVLSMAAAAVFVACSAHILTNRRAGLLAGLAFAVMPSVNRYGQEARSYALVTALASAATLLLVLGLRKPATRRMWFGYGVVVLSMSVLHSVAMLLLAGHAVIVGHWIKDWRSWKGALPWMVASLGALPGLVFAIHNRRYTGLLSWVPRPRWNDATLQLVGLPMSQGAVDAAALAVGLALIALALTRQDSTWWLAAYAVPVVLVWAISHGTTSLWLPRYMLPFTPLLAIAAGLGARKMGTTQLAVLGALLSLIALPTLLSARHPAARGPNYPEFAAIIAQNRQPGDSFLGLGRWQDVSHGMAINHYLPPDERPPLVANIGSGVWTLGGDPHCRIESSWTVSADTLRRCVSP